MKARGRLAFWGAVAALLAVMAAAQITSMLRENQTWDEAIHLAAGYSYLKTGSFRLNPEHPPLFKLLAAMTLLPLDPELPLEGPAWASGEQVAIGDRFLYRNRVPAETMLQRARGVTVALTMLLGIALAWWTRRKFGAAAALLATALFAFDPNIIAHGRYVTSDLIATLFVFLSVVTWTEYLERPGVWRLAAAGLAFGLALVSKFSAVFLVLVLPVLYLLRWWQIGRKRDLSLRNLVLSGVVMAEFALVVIGVCYGRETLRSLHGPRIEPDRSTFSGRALYKLTRRIWFPAHPYFNGLGAFAAHNREGHPSYLLGMRSEEGWWYYFPVAFAVKTPAGVLVLIAAALALALADLVRGRAWRQPLARLSAVPLAWFALLVPMLLYGWLSMRSHVNLGLRHILPIYPFLYVAVAVTLMRARRWIAMWAAMAALVAMESVWIYPDYLAFFNVFAGGPANGPRYLVDSNIDWGQDLKKLRAYLDSIGWKESICISYFGRGSMPLYELDYRVLPDTAAIAAGKKPECGIAAISVTSLHDVYTGESSYRWLRERRPIARVGYSIYVYDLREKTAL